MRALQHRPRQLRSLRAWLVTIAGNVARNIRRSDMRRTRREEAVARPEGVRWNDEYQRQQRDRRIIAAVLRLNEPYRSTILLRFYKGWTLTAIARDSCVSSTAVRKRLRRAFILLRSSLTPDSNTGSEEPNWRLHLPYESPAPS